MKKTVGYILCYFLGSILYPLIELIARGRTHISMSILGGICLCAIYFTHNCLSRGRILQKAFFSAILITQLEFICGVIVNLSLKLSVWDYSDRFLNLSGQICPLFTFFWFLLSLIPLTMFSAKERQG